MSYQIEYNPELSSRYPVLQKKGFQFSKYILVAVLICIITMWLLSKYEMLHFLIPGDSEVTKAAFSTLIEEVGNGSSVSDGIIGFCEEIISNAK